MAELGVPSRYNGGAGSAEPWPQEDRPELGRLSDRQLLEEIGAGLRRLEPFLEAAERHPWARGLLRRF